MGLALIVGLGVVLGVAADILSPSVWLDLLALWPVPSAGVIVGLVVWLARGRRRRHLAVVGLSIFTWLGLGLAWHLAGASWLPVSAADVAGPALAGVESARLAVDLDVGSLSLAGGSGVAYEVVPVRSGGSLGAPTSFEQQRGSDLAVVMVPRPEPGLFVFGGWRVRVGSDITWSFDLAVPALDLDLTSVRVAAATLRSDRSVVRLGLPSGLPTLTLTGTHTVVVPEGVAVSVVGRAQVPAGWTTSDGVAASPTGGAGWAITVQDGASVEIVTG